MAADLDESCLDFSDFHVPSLIQLQALCRRWLVRKRLRQAQKEFEGIVQELDGPSYTVIWTESSLPQPVVAKLSRRHKQETEKQTASVDSIQQPSDSAQQQSISIQQQNADSSETGSQSVQVSNQRLPLQPASVTHLVTRSDQQVQTDNAQNSYDTDVCALDSSVDGVPYSFRTELHSGVHSHGVDCEETVQKTAQSHGIDKGNQNNNRSNNDSNIDDIQAERVEPDRTLSPVTVEVVPMHDGQSQFSAPSGQLKGDSFHGDQTSVWDSSSGAWHEGHSDHMKSIAVQGKKQEISSRSDMKPDEGGRLLSELSTSDLIKQRQNVAMELLWVQQAIISRKKYLRLKSQMDGAS